jgi:UDP-N-acetylmuramoyl-tripeptide--D-alanyl-D-alanine ligase
MQGQDFSFCTVNTDTRQIKTGDLFIALQGENFDGHQFVKIAAERGACGAVVKQLLADVAIPQVQVADTLIAYGQIASYSRETRFKGRMLALTGSSGKTTVKEMTASILREIGPTHATEKNFNNEVGVPQTLLSLNEEHKFAVLEMGASKLGDIAYLRDLVKPDVVLVTNVLPAHLQGFGSIEAVAQTKGEIYQHLSAHAKAVLNRDEKNSEIWQKSLGNRESLTYSTSALKRADFYAATINNAQQQQIVFELCSPIGKTAIYLKVIGRHNVSNALGAAAMAYAAGATLEQIKAGLEKFEPVTGRMKLYSGVAGSRVIDDSYNANPGSVKAAIDAISHWHGNKVLVLGDMGELGADANQLHREIGEYARDQAIENLLTVGQLSREASKVYGKKGLHFPDQESLINYCKSIASADIVFLVKGSRSSKMEYVVSELTAMEGAI